MIIPDGTGGQLDEGTFELTILGATGVYSAFKGGHNHMVDRLHQLVAGTPFASFPSSGYNEFCFCIISQYPFPIDGEVRLPSGRMRDRLLPFCLRMRSPRSSDSSAKIRWRWGVETQISGGNLTIVLELCTQIPKLDVAGSIPVSRS